MRSFSRRHFQIRRGEMDVDYLARKTAAALAAEFGPELMMETEDALRAGAQPVARTRQVELLADVASAAVIAHFLITVIPIVTKYVGRGEKPEDIKRKVLEEAEVPSGIKPEIAKNVIA